jgi:hypothetical protein
MGWIGGVGVVVLMGTGCGAITGCKEDRQVVEVDFGSTFFEIQQRIVDSWRARGYNCEGESVRNAFGRTIGTKYTCTKCD